MSKAGPKATRSARAKATKASSRAKALEARLPGWLQRIIDQAQGKDILQVASGLAFYALISVAPLAILVLWVVGLIVGHGRIQALGNTLQKSAPKNLGVDQVFKKFADVSTSVGITATLAGLWPATSYGSGLVRGFDRLSPKKGRTLKGLRGRGLLLVVLLPLFVLGGLIGSYLGTTLLPGGVLGTIGGIALALVTGFAGAAVAVGLIYRIFPQEPLTWAGIWRGTAFTAMGISLLSLLFTLYLVFGANFQQHYGFTGLAAIVLLGLWLFLSNALLLLGYQVAVETS